MARSHVLAMCTNGRGLVVIITNDENYINGIQTDILTLEEFYKASPRHYDVIGGYCDKNSAEKKNLDLAAIRSLVKRIDNLYHPPTMLQGAEYDRIILHIFAPGSADYICVPNGMYKRKIHIRNDIADNLRHLQGQIPVVVNIHSSEPLPPGTALPAAPHDTVSTDNSPNVLGFFTHESDIDGYDARDSGSWFVQTLLQQLNKTYDVQAALEKANGLAQRKGLATTPIVDDGFKRLRLSYSSSPVVTLSGAFTVGATTS